MNEKQTFEEFLNTIPEELRASVQSMVDRERSNASITARKNAELALASDEKFLAGLEPKIREKIEKENNLTLEQKQQEFQKSLNDRENTIKLKENTLSAKSQLISGGYGLEESDVEEALKLIVDSDENVTKSKLDAFIKVLQPMAKKMAQTEINKQLKTYDNPQTKGPTGGQTEAEQIKKEYAEACARRDFRKMTSLARKAGELNISLK